MKILFISQDLVGGNIAYLMKKESHDVKLFINDKGRKGNFENLVAKIKNWRKELKWTGKKGLIIFDCNDFGKIQEKLRRKGYSVLGNCDIGDRLETDRQFGSEIMSKFGMKIVPTINFDSLDKAIKFVKKKRGKWVVKQNSPGTSFKSLNYVGLIDNGNDVVNVLEKYKKEITSKDVSISLQKKIEGVEIAMGRFFNGKDWVGPTEINLEHKKLFPGDLGPTTSEMGTLAWYENDENNKLYTETLKKLEPFLREIDYRGDIDINCIVNEKGIFPLEATSRLGSPIIHLQSELHISPWGKFLKAVADGKQYNLKWKKGYGIVIVVTVPTSNPFPFTKAERYVSPEGINIYFDKVAEKKMKHIHFEDVSLKNIGKKKQFYISDDRGYVLYVTSVGKTVEEARKKAYDLLKHIHIPKMFYRNDIGLKFIEEDQKKLKKWGYI